MNESQYWPRLMFRITGEFMGMRDRHLQYLWCDGFIPTDYLLESPNPKIAGRVWICNGDLQQEWEFTLILPARFRSLEEVDWASLLPPENVTRWLSFDPARKRIIIEPSVAVTDRR